MPKQQEINKPEPEPKEEVIPNLALIPLARKLVMIRANIGGFEKNKRADKYEYVGGSQVLWKILSEMNRLEVLLIPRIVHGSQKWQSSQFERTNKFKETKIVTDFIMEAEMIMQWMDATTGETIEVPWLLYGEQEGDIAKAFGSGLTYSERYFLMKFFNQPTDKDDPDAKKEKTDVHEKPINSSNVETEEQAKEKADKVANSPITKSFKDGLIRGLTKKGVDQQEVFDKFSVQSLDELTMGQCMEFYKILDGMEDKKKGVEGI